MGVSVAILDDDISELYYYAHALEEVGITPHQFHDVDEFLNEMSNAHLYSAFILDCVMPPASLSDTDYGLLTGLVVAKRVRQQYKDEPIIVLTNHNNTSIADGLVKICCARILHKKNTTPSVLASQVRRAISKMKS
jgi:FixJ family two-component response regulator